jgi:hypothetical protein
MSDSKLSVPSGVLIWVVAIIATAGTLCLLDTASHALAWNFAAPFTADAGAPVTTLDERVSLHSLLAPLGYLAILIFYCVVLGRGWAFVNRSSHHGLYAARLNRTYLGASNPARTSGAGQNVTSPVQGDDFDMGEYWSATAHDHGAPLHLVNVTVNQTVSARSGTLNRDRKGLPMCIGPSALSGGVSHHYLLDSKLPRPSELPPPGYWMFLPRTAPTNRVLAFFTGKVSPKLEFEKLSLGQWVAISGAAFTTGAGYQTTLATSLLTGLGNIRLGYWWNSGSGRDDVGQGWFSRTVRWAFPVQMHLFDEFTANFRGPHEPYWYLSDGGHFENMAAYEMIRRRLPVIVIVDGEADPNYTYEGLANLVRKARTDFGAEIEFLSRERLDQLMGGDRGAFGELSDLRFDEKTHLSNAHAAIARVTYSSDPSIASIIIYLKPTLMRDIPADVREYQENNPPFPQQPTLDQFFDEMQWESYRRLGEHVGERAFARTAKGAWSPGDLRLPPKPDPKNPGDEPHPFWR